MYGAAVVVTFPKICAPPQLLPRLMRSLDRCFSEGVVVVVLSGRRRGALGNCAQASSAAIESKHSSVHACIFEIASILDISTLKMSI